MRVVFVAVIAVVFAASPGFAVDPWFVTTDIPFEGPRYDSRTGNWEGQREFWKQEEACDYGQYLAAPYRVPQFWDQSEIKVIFELEWRWYDGHPACADFNRSGGFVVHIRIARPSHNYIDSSDGIAYPDVMIIGDLEEFHTFSPSMRHDPVFTFYYDVARFNADPGEMLRIEINVTSDEDSVYCQCINPLMIRHLRVVAPVVLPFVFENGFEEGQAAFWSALYGGS